MHHESTKKLQLKCSPLLGLFADLFPPLFTSLVHFFLNTKDKKGYHKEYTKECFAIYNQLISK